MEKHCESAKRFRKEGDGGQGSFGFAASTDEAPGAKAAKLRVPIYRVTLLRDGTLVKESLETCDSPLAAASLVREFLGDAPEEHFVTLVVDVRHRVIGISEVSRGTLSSSLVHPRETFRTAILLNAAGIIVSHNHPSGDCQPSPEDKETTRRLTRAGAILGIPLLDHVIVGEPDPQGGAGKFFSFREHGLLS